MTSSTAKNTSKNVAPLDISVIQAFAQLSATVLDLDDLLVASLDILFQTFHYDILAVIFVDDETEELVVKAYKSDLPFNRLDKLPILISETIETGSLIHKEGLFLGKNLAEEQSCLIIPLTIGRLVIGALVTANLHPYEYPPQEKQLLTILASQMTVALTNAQLYKRTREQQQQEFIRRQIATHLQQLSTVLNATLNLDDVLKLILEHIESVIPYNSALILLLQGQDLVVQAIAGLSREVMADLTLKAEPGGFYQAILQQQYPAIFHDVTQDERWLQTSLPAMQNIKAWIGAPLVIKDQTIGMLTLHHKEPGYFDNADLDLVHTFANQAAIAIDNAQVYQREQQKVKQFQTVAKIGRQATEIHEVQPLLDTVVERLHEDLSYEFVTIFLYQNQTDDLLLKAANDIPQEAVETLNYRLPLDGRGVISTSGRTGEPLLVNDTNAFERYFPRSNRELVRSELAIPLSTKGQLIGLLDIQSTRLYAFSPDDLTLAQTIADQLAVAIATANLFEEKDRRMAELLAFNEIGVAIADPSDLNKTLNAIIGKIKALYQVEGTSLMILNNDVLHLKIAAGISAEMMKPFTLKLGEGFAGWVAQHNRSLRIDDVASDARYYQNAEQTLNFAPRTLLAVPVQIQGRVLGVIEIVNRLDDLPFTRDDQVILSFIASAVAITMENSRLFAELSRKADQMAGLFEASQSLTNLDLGEVLRTTTRQVVNLLESQWAAVYLIDDTGTLAVPGASSSNNEIHLRPRVYDITQGTVGWVLKHKKPLRINDVQNDSRFSVTDDLSHTIFNVLTVPLIARGKVIGILETTNKKHNNSFTAEDEAFMTALASQAAMAIHNAQLFQDVLDREAFVLALGKAGTSINKSLNLDEVLDVICSQSLTLFNIDGVSVWRFEDETLLCLAARGTGSKQLLDTRLVPKKSDLFVSQVFKADKPLYKNNFNDIAAYGPNLSLKANAIAILGVPLQKGGISVGVLLMVNIREPNYFSDEDLGQAVIYSNQITTAIENAHLHQETTTRLAEVSTLYTLAHQMSINLDINRLLEGTVNVIRLALDSLGSSIFLLKDGELILGAQNGRFSIADHAFIINVVRQTIDMLKPINLRNSEDFERIVHESSPPNIQSLLMVPLITHGKLLGALAVYDKRSYAFGDNEGRLLTIAAVQVASALENSKLFNDLQQHAKNLERALKELQEVSRLQNEFVQNVSHELRTPLTFVKAYVDLILEESLGPISDAVRNSLEIVARRTDDLNRLVSDIITHQQLQMRGLEFSQVNIANLINLAVNSAILIVEKHDLHLEANIPPSLPIITADPNRISQVLDNLIGNAIKFTTNGGKITVSAETMDNFVRISVKDTGVGIKETELKKIFNRFYQVDGSMTRRFGGTGLGLTIVKQIVEAHQGTIDVKSKPGKGSEFSFTLPVNQPESYQDHV